MKKKIRRRPPDEIKVIVNKKLDDMEKEKKPDDARKCFERKPYEVANGKV